MKLSSIPVPVWQLGASVVGGLVVLYLLRHYGTKVGQAVNPLNDKNVFYSSANALGSALGGDEDFSLGAKVYDWTHPDEPFTR